MDRRRVTAKISVSFGLRDSAGATLVARSRMDHRRVVTARARG